MINTYNGGILRDVGGIEITRTFDNPRYAIPLFKGIELSDEARIEAIRLAKQELETQRFINAVFAANTFPSNPMVNIF